MPTMQKKLEYGRDYREELRKAVSDRRNLITIANNAFKKTKQEAHDRFIKRVNG